MAAVRVLLLLLAVSFAEARNEPVSRHASSTTSERRVDLMKNTRGSSSLAPRVYRRQRKTPVTRALLYANGIAFVALFNRNGVFKALAKNDLMIRRSNAQSYRLLTACFLHANLPHLLVNCYSLNALGNNVEPWFGSRRTGVVYASAGLAGNLLSLRTGTAPVSVGASGCIFGLLGAWTVFLCSNYDFFAASGVDVRSSLRSLAETCVLNVFIGMRAGSMIDHAGHLGGLVGGAAATYVIGPRLRRSVAGFIVDEPLVRLPGADGTARRRRKLGRTSRKGGAVLA